MGAGVKMSVEQRTAIKLYVHDGISKQKQSRCCIMIIELTTMMIIVLSIASDMIYDYTCTPCEDNGGNSEAVFYCGNCTKQLCDSCVVQHNRLFKRHTVLGQTDKDKWGEVKKETAMEMCGKHAGKEIDMYCEDHDSVCCHICERVEHRNCKIVKHLPDAAKGIQQKSEFKSLVSNATKLKTQLRRFNEARKKNGKSLQKSCQNIRASMNKIRVKVNKKIDEVEKKDIAEMVRIHTSLDAAIKYDMNCCMQIHDDLENYLAKMQDTNNESMVFMGSKKCQESVKEAENLMSEISRGDYEMTYEENTSIDQLLSSLETLGKFHTSTDTGTSDDSDHIYTVQASRQYDIRISSDKVLCYISGMCMLPNGNLVVNDYKNQTVKMLNDSLSVISHCSTKPYWPFDISHISGDEVAVSVSDDVSKGYVQFLDTSNNKLQLTRKFQLDYGCGRIVHYGGQLYVGSGNAIYIYTTSGQLVRQLYEDTSGGATVFRFSPSQDGRQVYITNFDQHQLITIDQQGNKLAILQDTDLQYPSGVCVTSTGEVFVCGGDSHTVVQVHKDGSQKLATVARATDGLSMPTSLVFDRKTSRLIVGQHYCDKLTVLKLA